MGEGSQALRGRRNRQGTQAAARKAGTEGADSLPDLPGGGRRPEPPRGWRRAFLLAVDLLLHRHNRLVTAGRHHLPPERPVLILTNHRRDVDGPLVASMLLDRRGFRFRGPLPHFVAREDLLNPGFLRGYLTSWPGWLRSLLGSLRLGAFLRALRVHPMRRFPEQTLGEVLAEVCQVCGDLPLEEVLRPAWLARFSGTERRNDPLCVSQALHPRYRPLLDTRFGLRRLRLACFRRLKARQRGIVAAQLGEVVGALKPGAAVHFVPEGRVSPHGKIRRLREGTHRLLDEAGRETAVLPMGIIHDDLNTARPRVCLAMGPEVPDWRELGRSGVEQAVRGAVQAQVPVALSQLASAHLLELGGDGQPITAAELEAHVAAEAERFHARGARVDPLLREPRARRRRVVGFLRYCRRHGLVAADREGFRVQPRRIGPPDPWRPEGSLRYAANEREETARYWGLGTDDASPPAG